jgi:hypothetical protein
MALLPAYVFVSTTLSARLATKARVIADMQAASS